MSLKFTSVEGVKETSHYILKFIIVLQLSFICLVLGTIAGKLGQVVEILWYINQHLEQITKASGIPI